MDFNAFLLSPDVKEAFGANREFTVLLRPDNHIALIASEVSLDHVRRYFDKFIDCR